MSKISQAVADILNEALAADPAAMYHLQATMVPCNEKLADHPHIIVRSSPLHGAPIYNVGMLGVINGVLAKLGETPVCSVWDEAPKELVNDDFRNNFILSGFKIATPESAVIHVPSNISP